MDRDFNNLESTQHEDASTDVLACPANLFIKDLSIYTLCKNSTPPIVAQRTPGNHGLNKNESTLPKDASTQVTAC